MGLRGRFDFAGDTLRDLLIKVTIAELADSDAHVATSKEEGCEKADYMNSFAVGSDVYRGRKSERIHRSGTKREPPGNTDVGEDAAEQTEREKSGCAVIGEHGNVRFSAVSYRNDQ